MTQPRETPGTAQEPACTIESELAERDATIARLTQALNIIASWGEGPDVNSSFDEPSSAAEARAALAKATP